MYKQMEHIIILLKKSQIHSILFCLFFFISISCQRESVNINEAQAQIVATGFLEDYCKAEGYDCRKMKPSAISKSCECLDALCKEKKCEDGPAIRYDNISKGWQFNFSYQANPRHEFSIFVGNKGEIYFSSNMGIKNFGLGKHRIDYNKYRSLIK